MKAELLHYRQWEGTFRRPAWAVWPIARVALGMVFRRKLFWILYALSLLIFLMFFFGGLLLDWAVSQLPATPIQFGKARPDPERMIAALRRGIAALNGSQETYAYFFGFQKAMAMVTLALTGAILVGKDYVDGSVPFFLAKPISRWHYILGKCLAVGIVVNMITTLPALVLFVQHSMSDWNYLVDPDYFHKMGGRGPAGLPLLLGILGYGLLLTVVMSVLLVAVASWVRRTMPLIMVWSVIIIFLDIVSDILVDGLKYPEQWRLISVWNNLRVVGRMLLSIPFEKIRPRPQPALWEVILVLVVVCLLCLSYLNRRTRAVEIVK